MNISETVHVWIMPDHAQYTCKFFNEFVTLGDGVFATSKYC